ncbi:hypothetical protein [Azohydromonas caseinilytica]|uniref:Uncharacterized protein n=1 Tax=Azohydromonas caseinilytica TaxID=2728836 RepID=A0A848FFY3_9BURK|nr:hypothetical protein [Azohydromonas caseinilytica]NML17050.1 hypothetical protein [Azohydromonas caseinilytica]
MYYIEKYRGTDSPETDNNRHSWEAALGLKSGRSYFDAQDDDEAREKFDAELKRTRCGFFRLSCFAGFGYGIHARQVTTKDFSNPHAAPGAAGAGHQAGRRKET